jgi:hypothetical protein
MLFPFIWNIKNKTIPHKWLNLVDLYETPFLNSINIDRREDWKFNFSIFEN